MHFSRLSLCLWCTILLLAACSSDGGAGGMVPAPPLGCDPLTPSYCAFPYPNDYYTVADASTVTGLRLALPAEIMPPTSGTKGTPQWPVATTTVGASQSPWLVRTQ